MRICIVGAGLSGLSTAFYLSEYENVVVTVHEASSVFGGRANVIDGAEHCARIFLDDYTHLFAILSAIEGDGGNSVLDSVQPLRRLCLTETMGWVEISHLYPLMARELPVSERVRMLRANRTSPILAAQRRGRRARRYTAGSKPSIRSLIKVAANLIRSKGAHALTGPTDRCLVDPWVRHLERRGVRLRKDARIDQIRTDAEGVDVLSMGRWARFEAVVITAFFPDMVQLLNASDLPHFVPPVGQANIPVLTIDLDPREPALTRGMSILSERGVAVIVQPECARCIAICTRQDLVHDTAHILREVTRFLDLQHGIQAVRIRDNQTPDEAIYTSDYVDPTRILAPGTKHVHFAGSYTRNSYPVDSGEGAARSASEVVKRLETAYGLRRR